MDKLKVFSADALGDLVCKHLSISPTPLTLRKFSNGETLVQINASVRNQDVYIIYSSSNGNVNDAIMQLLVLISACRGGSAARITAVIPDFPYANQSKMNSPRSPITARMLADLIIMAGADHVVLMDLKASQMQGFFDKPVDNLYAGPTLARWATQNIEDCESVVVVSKDPAGTKRVAELADRLSVNFAMVHQDVKLQGSPLALVGNVKNKPVIILDDSIAKPDLFISAARFCKEVHGATNVYIMATHGVFLDDCLERLEECDAISKIVVTNTHEVAHKSCGKLEVIDISTILAECVRRLHNGESISQLFKVNQANL